MPFERHPNVPRRLKGMPGPDVLEDGGVVLRRESIWYVAGTDGRPHDRRGHFVAAVWSAFVAPGTLRAFERVGIPLLRAMRGLHAARVAVVRLSASTFDAGETRRLIEQAAAVDAMVMVELTGLWSTPALEVLGAIRPAFVRVRQEYTAGASVLPEQSRRLLQLSDCMVRASTPLVAQGPMVREDDAAARAAGIDLRVVTESGAGESPWPAGESLGAPVAPVVLDFPLRPPGR
jgi:hypothetical protein